MGREECPWLSGWPDLDMEVELAPRMDLMIARGNQLVTLLALFLVIKKELDQEGESDPACTCACRPRVDLV